MLNQRDPENESLADKLSFSTDEERAAIFAQLPLDELKYLEHSWKFWGRPKQQEPGEDCQCGCRGRWLNWVLLSGRGFGKSRTGSEWVHKNAYGTYGRFNLVGATAAAVRDIIVEGESGIMETMKPWNTCRYQSTKNAIVWQNGAKALTFSAEEPERLRGHQAEAAWCIAGDEPVLTLRGQVSISDVNTLDSVWTRKGWRRVLAHRLTQHEAQVLEVRTSNGLTLRCTPNHRVWANGAWSDVQNLEYGDILQTWNLLTDPLRGEDGKDSAGSTASKWVGIADQLGFPWLKQSGLGTTVLSPQDMKSTIKTKTRPTTISTTWSPFSEQSIAKSMEVLTAKKPRVAMLGSEQCGPNVSLNSESVLSAMPTMKHFQPTPAIAARNVQPALATVVSVRDSGFSDVYDLTVEDAHEFIAGGLLVHNCDELAAWTYMDETWRQLQMGLRLGPFPRTVVTTTPKPLPLIKRLVKDKRNHVTRGNTFENISNLSETFIHEITQTYEGTRFGRQEIEGEILDESDMALWSRELLDNLRIEPEVFWPKDETRGTPEGSIPPLKRIVIGVDPSMSFGTETAAETGIVVCGLGRNDHAYVLQDASGKYKPEQWAKKVATLYHYWMADRVIAEANQGHALVKHTIAVEDPTVAVKDVHAQKNKITRAEPISTAYERERVHHVGNFKALEDQMCLSADTLVLTLRGNIPIASVRKDDFVLTRFGWYPLRWAGRTGIASTIQIQVDNLLLSATLGHPLHVNGEFVPAAEVLTGWVFTTLHQPEKWANMVHKWNGMDASGLRSREGTTAIAEENFSTEPYGNITTSRKSQRDSMSTTKTIIRQIISHPTWKQLPVENMSPTTHERELPPGIRSYGARSTENGGNGGLPKKSNVWNAESLTRQLEFAQSSVRPDVECGSIQSVIRNKELVPVYNLTVDGPPEFFANGLLVHNCQWEQGDPNSPDRMDAMVWAMTDLIGKKGLTSISGIVDNELAGNNYWRNEDTLRQLQ